MIMMPDYKDLSEQADHWAGKAKDAGAGHQFDIQVACDAIASGYEDLIGALREFEEKSDPLRQEERE